MIVDNSSDWFDIIVNDEHPFYNLFKELSKDNEELYNYYFREKNGTKIKDTVLLRVNGENIQNVKQFCKLDVKVRILFKEGVLFKNESDPQYFSEWRFLLNLNKVDFM